MAAFFADFAAFDHNPVAPLLQQFERLAIEEGWQRGSKRYKTQKRKCLQAEEECLESRTSKLGMLQSLCEEVEITDVPSSITQCKKLLSDIYINIFDLIDARRSGLSVLRFNSRKELCKYSKKKHKIYPLTWAKADGMFRMLLIVMH